MKVRQILILRIKNILGKINIERPTFNQNYIRPDNKNITLSGWAVSNDSNSTIRIFIDENKVNPTITRIYRSDVDKAISVSFGGTQNTPKAGYQATLDIGNLSNGKHIIKIQEISRYGDLICEASTNINLQNKKYLGEICIDNPNQNKTYKNGDIINVTGWAVSNDENSVVGIYVDGQFKANASRHYRGDVVNFMKKYENKTQNAGFVSDIIVSGLSDGTHTLTVREKSRYGEEIVKSEVKFIVQTPSVNNNVPPNNTLTAGSKGIDVSQFQGNINWSQVANSGIKYAMIRIGYRGYGKSGGLAEDTKYKDNFKNAKANGLKVGIYYYSTALNTAEAQKDAEYVITLLKKYGYQNQVTMPIAIDLEVNEQTARDAKLSKQTRTDVANTFCSIIKSNGYTPMVYASKSFLISNMNASQVNYDIWCAQYNSKCTYTGNYTMWQYSDSGKVSGINGNVDCNICYKNY